MPTRNKTAAKLRKEKEEHPDRFCQFSKCLWRGLGCPKHSWAGMRSSTDGFCQVCDEPGCPG